jgi:guanyl-specific ribonuclease Sa
MLKSKNAIFVLIALVLALGFLALRSRSESPAPTASHERDEGRAGPTLERDEGRPIASTGNAARDVQVRLVIASMDTSKKPPEGVSQGGNPPGVFKNREGRLPRGGTYIESDIWPSRGRSRGTERLIFGQNGEVWFTEDHYETFKRIR